MAIEQRNNETRAAWNTNAAYWDRYMGEAGNDFVNVLIWPPTLQLLDLQPGQHVLDIACGDGVYAPRLAALMDIADIRPPMRALVCRRTGLSCQALSPWRSQSY